jgi:hypothetical protein
MGLAPDGDGWVFGNATLSLGPALYCIALRGWGLSKCHSALTPLTIWSLRRHFAQFGTPPSLPHACRAAGLDPLCMDRLFHNAREAWRIAGLPDPGEEAKSYM